MDNQRVPVPLPRFWISKFRKIKAAVLVCFLVGLFVVSFVVPKWPDLLRDWMPENRHAFLGVMLLIFGSVGFLTINAVVIAWRRLERWRLSRRTWHRRPSRSSGREFGP